MDDERYTVKYSAYCDPTETADDGSPVVTFSAKLTNEDEALFNRLCSALERAKELHPVFAEGIYQGLGRIGEEFGELNQSVNHGESEKRIDAEAMDLLVVVWRFLKKEYNIEGD